MDKDQLTRKIEDSLKKFDVKVISLDLGDHYPENHIETEDSYIITVDDSLKVEVREKTLNPLEKSTRSQSTLDSIFMALTSLKNSMGVIDELN